MEATLARFQKLQNQHAVNIALLKYTASNVQNIPDTSATYLVQLSSNVSSELDNIRKILNTNYNPIDKDIKKSYYNQNHTYNTVETSNLTSKQQFTSI